MVEEKVGGRKGRRRVEVRTERERRGSVGCLVAGVEGVVRRARRWSLLRRRKESCRGCMGGEEEVGRLANLEDECRLKCGDEADQVIACSIMDVEADFVWVVVAEAVAAVEDSSDECWTKESMLALHCRSIHIGEVKPEDARGPRCGTILGVRLFEVKDDGSRRMVVDSVILACSAQRPCYQGNSLVCCRANPGHRPKLGVLPCGGQCPVAWRIHRDEQSCPGPVPEPRCESKAHCSTGGTWSSPPVMLDTSWSLPRMLPRSLRFAHTSLAYSSP